MNEQIQSELKKIFNSRFSTSVSTRTNYARGEDTYDPVLSKAVVFPETNEEVSKILKLCNDHKVPVVPFGTGTSLEGNVVVASQSYLSKWGWHPPHFSSEGGKIASIIPIRAP